MNICDDVTALPQNGGKHDKELMMTLPDKSAPLVCDTRLHMRRRDAGLRRYR
ncbi:hypothetical protein KCP69_10200 [Salmonella enterica subsp. enterica]|nr:hypothetical protein KCP69_10200 [Salmonella enterica subsp. enterica]